MGKDKILAEAKRLHSLGFAIHWLHNKSKRPVESGWTTGPRKSWEELLKSYREGMNVGVRLGEPSKIRESFLGVIDVDVKSTDPKHAKEVSTALRDFTNNINLPEVKSGRGNGSRHFYFLSAKPAAPRKALQSPDVVKVPMPSVRPSKRELEALSAEEIEKGLRLRPAWEIAIMGQGQQVVLPPSIHPDSGKCYAWQNDFEASSASKFNIELLPNVEKSVDTVENLKVKETLEAFEDFEISPVDISWLPITDKVRAMIVTGAGVDDRSAMLLPVSHALYSAGLTRNEILTVLTDPKTFLGVTAYNHAQTKSRTRAAAWLWKYTVKKVFDEKNAEKMFREPIIEGAGIERTAEEIKEDENDFDAEHWTDLLDVTDGGKYRATIKNILDILIHEAGADFVRRDLFAYRDAYGKDTPWGGVKGAALVDDDNVLIKVWLSREWGFEPSQYLVSEALTKISLMNAFDPVKDWLNGLPAWDEVERLDTWLEKYFEAKVNDRKGCREYYAQVFRKWIVGMVLRGLKPGAHFPWMPIFEGAQGIGKSSFGRILVGKKYFLDWLPDLNDKDASLALQGAWAVEMGELSSMRKNEIEVIKAYLTRTVDKFRPPHGRKNIESERRCVFFGTTNNATYLKDDSGNRRFKPLEVGNLDFERLTEDREQLFAEAVYLFKNGFESEATIELSGDARVYEKLLQSEKMVQDESDLMAEKLIEFWDKNQAETDPEKRFNFNGFSMSALFDGPIHRPLHLWKFDSRNVQFAGKALKKLGGRSGHAKKGNKWFLDRRGLK